MTPEVQETIELMKEWKEEIRKITTDYNTAISNLNGMKDEFKKKSWFERHKDWILPILIPGAIVTIGILAVNVTQSDIKIGEVTISKQKECNSLPSTPAEEYHQTSSTVR